MSTSQHQTAPAKKRQKWYSLAVIGMVLLLIPRRSSRQNSGR